LQRTSGSAAATGSAGAGGGAAGDGIVFALCAEEKFGETIGAPIVAFGITGAAAAGGGIAAVGGDAARVGATALNPASVSTIGDIGADSQSSPSSTLLSAIATTAL
jgi:hypothetical protein